MRIKQLTVGMMGVCCYIVSCEKTNKAVIIDPGGDEDKILKTCSQDKLDIEYIIATHGHPDHVCGNKVLQDASGAKIIMHKEDAAFFDKADIANYFSALGLPQSPPADILVEDGDTITFGEEKLEVIHTPGHTPGGICLYSMPDCFTGDTLFVGGVGRTDFPGGSSKIMLESIKNRLLNLPLDTTVWPGHGYGGSKSTIGEEMKSNMFLR